MNKQTFKAIIFAGLFAVPFIPFLVYSSFFFPFITTKAFTFRIIVEIVFAAWVILALIDKGYRPKKSPVLYALAIFLVITGVANIFSVDSVRSFWSNFERMEGFISLLHLGAFFLVISSVFREVDWKRWWNTSLAASALMVIYALLQLAGSVTIHQGGVRVDGTLGNATYLAVYMLFHIFIALYFLWRERASATLRWLYSILILGQVFILYHTATRGAILGLLGGLLVIALLNIRNKEDYFIRKGSLALLTVLFVLSGGFFLLRQSSFIQNSPVLSRFTQLNFNDIYQGRYYVWPMAIEGFKERPILGWGQENFIYIFERHYKPEMFNLEPWFDRAHNTYLDWLATGGFLGLFGYLALYVAALYLIWRGRNDFSHVEKSILTGLLAAYAFHNLFVFDHLISYILFFSLLAYVHQRSGKIFLADFNLSEDWVKKVALPAVAIVFLFAFYFGNIKPLIANVYMIEALKSLQLQTFDKTGEYFKKAYEASTLGREEVVQHLAANSVTVLESNISLEKKNEFYGFAKQVVVKEAESHPRAAKRQLLAGSFLVSTGFPDEALVYLGKAREIMPGKQQVYFDTASAYFAKGDPATGLSFFKKAYDLAPAYQEAKIIYLIGAIYVGDRQLENKLLAELPADIISKDNRIVSAYKVVGR